MRTRSADKQQLVKRKAIDLLVSDGFEGFSMNKLAKACNVSVATLYIYYKDKDDLIIQVAIEEAQRFTDEVLSGFDQTLNFADGIRQQWKRRAQQLTKNPKSARFFDQLRTSTYNDRIHPFIVGQFKEAMGDFMLRAVANDEIDLLPMNVFWSVAYGPLYNLIRFHNEGKGLTGQPFVLTDEILEQTCELVIKALKK
ncbi:TetR/AcrR family transcriptional regulator [Mucilaginibacter hurinus]|uniref:TetR/AcrR family transcriptional regulator n=1 Tax=Mucilaginibacter hurinus TaxID=2201324 RepID=A0A367GQ61_9SPHI|nr:TetR/AcrR family transcriptional regulator [Mucilaginibacter hurinus]RCH55592.1 TetR/AcrR family transcriptional regulator [Mucilaginibacter hurinus]